jgi:hypothetical protein
MDKKLHRDRDPVRAISAVIFVMVAITAIFAITVERNGIRIASDEQSAAGSSGMARPHPPLDRAPGEALRIPL